MYKVAVVLHVTLNLAHVSHNCLSRVIVGAIHEWLSVFFQDWEQEMGSVWLVSESTPLNLPQWNTVETGDGLNAHVKLTKYLSLFTDLFQNVFFCLISCRHLQTVLCNIWPNTSSGEAIVAEATWGHKALVESVLLWKIGSRQRMRPWVALPER